MLWPKLNQLWRLWFFIYIFLFLLVPGCWLVFFLFVSGWAGRLGGALSHLRTRGLSSVERWLKPAPSPAPVQDDYLSECVIYACSSTLSDFSFPLSLPPKPASRPPLSPSSQAPARNPLDTAPTPTLITDPDHRTSFSADPDPESIPSFLVSQLPLLKKTHLLHLFSSLLFASGSSLLQL